MYLHSSTNVLIETSSYLLLQYLIFRVCSGTFYLILGVWCVLRVVIDGQFVNFHFNLSFRQRSTCSCLVSLVTGFRKLTNISCRFDVISQLLGRGALPGRTEPLVRRISCSYPALSDSRYFKEILHSCSKKIDVCRNWSNQLISRLRNPVTTCILPDRSVPTGKRF